MAKKLNGADVYAAKKTHLITVKNQMAEGTPQAKCYHVLRFDASPEFIEMLRKAWFRKHSGDALAIMHRFDDLREEFQVLLTTDQLLIALERAFDNSEDLPDVGWWTDFIEEVI